MVELSIYIVWSHQLFFEAVGIIMQSPGINIVGASSNYANAVAEIQRLRPSTVLIEIEEGHSHMNEDFLKILETSEWNPRIIRLSLNDNVLIVYHREQQVIDHIEDLLNLIQRD